MLELFLEVHPCESASCPEYLKKIESDVEKEVFLFCTVLDQLLLDLNDLTNDYAMLLHYMIVEQKKDKKEEK